LLDTAICEKMSEGNLIDIFDKIDKNLDGSQIDIIVGGPPCQAYSLVGRSIKSAKDKTKSEDEIQEDPRNYLYKIYCHFLNKYKPKMFVFENVTGLITAQGGKYLKDFIELATKCGYIVEYKTLKSEEYGVLQSRRRVFVIGWQKELRLKYPEFEKINYNTTVNEMFADLPKLKPGEVQNIYGTDIQQDYLTTARIRDDNDILTWHVARPHTDRDREIYRHVIRKWDNGHKRLRYNELPRELKTHKNIKSFIDRFKIVEGDTSACHTMMAHIAKDGHYFIHPDIEQARSISVREAARIQSFPDNYYFEGSRTAAFTQIGNAVPPLMAEQIAKALKVQLQKK
jgi:DNA (cytosine-5)-methyltransferase 1